MCEKRKEENNVRSKWIPFVSTCVSTLTTHGGVIKTWLDHHSRYAAAAPKLFPRSASSVCHQCTYARPNGICSQAKETSQYLQH